MTWTEQLSAHRYRAVTIERDGISRWVACPESLAFLIAELGAGMWCQLYAAAESYNASLKG